MSKKAKLSIDDLQEECLLEILHRLSGDLARSASACVSKRWLALISDVKTLETYYPSDEEGHNNSLTRCLKDDESTDIRLVAASVGTSSRGGLKELEIWGSHPHRGVSDVGLKAIAHSSPRLKVLSLWDVPSIEDAGLVEMANKCLLLEELNLGHCPSVTDQGLMAISLRCQRLKSVSIIACPLVGDLGVEDLVFSTSSVLAKLELQGLSIRNKTIDAIGRYGKALTTLVLIGLQEVGTHGSPLIGNIMDGYFEKLVSLTISSCYGTTDAVLLGIGEGCRSLKQMSLQECSLISDYGVKTFFRVCDSLESLQLEECNKITLSGVFGVLSSCRLKFTSLALIKCKGIKDLVLDIGSIYPCESLCSLSIKKCSRFGNSSLAMVSNLCPKLHSIILSGICAVTDNGIIDFVNACGFLKSLKLEKCNTITLLGVLGVLSSCRSKLKSLALVKCMGIRDIILDISSVRPCESYHSLSIKMCLEFGNPSLVVISMLCPNLRNISLSGLCKITDTGLRSLVDSCSADGLVDVKLSECTKLTDDVVLYIVHKHGLSLQVLYLDGCVKVTDASLVAVEDHCFELRNLDVSKCSITDHGVAALSSGMMLYLDILSISGCSSLTDMSLPSLLILGEKLIQLNIKNCNSISYRGVDKLKDSLRGCRVIA